MGSKLKKCYSKRSTSSFIFLTPFFILVGLYYKRNYPSGKSYSTKFQNNKCGLILFVHINKCGGGTFTKWLKQHTTVLFSFQATPRIKSLEQLGHDRWRIWNDHIPVANDFVGKIKPHTGWKAFLIFSEFQGCIICKKMFVIGRLR